VTCLRAAAGRAGASIPRRVGPMDIGDVLTEAS
jgi:hypothetical protein